MNKLQKAIKASILCLKFPFLYPRNRFTNRHVTGILLNKCSKVYQKAILEIGVTAHLEKEPERYYYTVEQVFDISIKLDKENKKLTISNKTDTKEVDLTTLLCRDDRFKILGLRPVFGLSGKLNIVIYVKPKDETDKTNYGFGYKWVNLLKSRFKYRIYKILSWIDQEILDRIFFIPTYTELDDMPDGWRKAFGMEMCKEIKKALKKEKGALKRYRIVQIKEKFGGLRWYDNCINKEVHDIIDKYQAISFRTCIDCGKPAEYISVGWISPYCKDCRVENHNYVPISEESAWDKALNPDWFKDEE